MKNISDDGYFIVEELRHLREVTTTIDTSNHERISQLFHCARNLETTASSIEKLLGSIRTVLIVLLLVSAAHLFR